MTRRKLWDITTVRRSAQIVFLCAFVGLIAATRLYSGENPSPTVVAWLKSFFLVDPLVLVSTWLTTHAFYSGALVALITIALTIILGRVFCGWFCPFGAVHDIAGRIFDLFSKKRRRPHDHWSPWQRSKYFMLVGFLTMAVVGAHWVCILDPLVLLYRSTTTGLLPFTQWAAESGSKAVADAAVDPSEGLADGQSASVAAKAKYWIALPASKVTEPSYVFLRDQVFAVPHQAFVGGGTIFALFVGLVLLNGYRRRFWCRYVCPLGALLGLFAWRPLLRRNVNKKKCNACDLCSCGCHGASSVGRGDNWIASECLVCLNCDVACHRDALHFTFASPLKSEPKIAPVDLSKRTMFASAVGGVAALGLMRITPQSRELCYNPALIRPPGSREEKEFLARCMSCGACMKACPNGAIHPAITEAGLEGLWTPRMIAKLGYCSFNCNLCGQVCPTEAIRPLPLEEKQKTRIGLAAFDVTRCIPYAYGRNCMVCEECCPIADKAIFGIDREYVDHEGNKRTVRVPYVDPTRCIGCGNCEYVCPYKDKPGIYVTSANESRNPNNQPLLSGGGY